MLYKVPIAKAELERRGVLWDEAYRGILAGEGLTSAAEMNEAQFTGIMQAFKRLGFVYGGKPARASTPESTERIGGTEWQVERIRKLWTTKARNPAFAALWAFVKRIAHIDAPAWLDIDSAQKVLVALEKMHGRTE